MEYSLVGFKVDVEFIWGFQAKVAGYSKTSPSFYYPPPTTILGAVAESLAKENNIGEKKGKEIIPRLAQNLLALGIRPLNCVPIRFSDINKLIAIKITGGVLYPDAKDLFGSFDAPATGKTLLTTLDKQPPTLRIFLVFITKEITLDERKEMILDKSVLWNIHRIGTKESIASVVDVDEFSPDKRSGRAETQYSFPLIDGVKPLDYIRPKWVSETLINPFSLKSYDENDNPVKNYLMGEKTVRYFLPILQETQNLPSYAVELLNNMCFYEKDGERVVGICRQ